ncbi:MAG: glycoside hydrolase family 15 protein, partial [Ferroplasma sp.]
MGMFNGLHSLKDIYRSGYLNIKDHGFIANNRTSALVGMDGTIDWACFPNFNSMPVFDSILDSRRGGYFMAKPTCSCQVNQFYEEFTNILKTEFIEDNKTVLTLTDFLPVTKYSNINFPEIHRFIEAPYRDIEIKIEIKPDFNFGRDKYKIKKTRNGYLFTSKQNNLGVSTDMKLSSNGNMVFNDKLLLEKGSYEWIVILNGIKRIGNVREYRSYERLEDTLVYWKKWTDKIQYSGMYYDYVLRSALTLKGLFYEPTGMMVAAPTTSLPESIGGSRNWDYRYTWIRDTTDVIESLSMIGLKDEASKFLYDIMSVIQEDNKLDTIYPINGNGLLHEEEINFSGYQDSKPVRIGNGASGQLQIDQYGSIINAVYRFQQVGGLVTTYLWDFIIDILEKLKALWRLPDSSIWEFRSEPRQYVYSKFISCTAFHRAILIGKKIGYSGPYREWARTMKEIRKEIFEKGYNKEVGAFTQYYGSDQVDASLLRMPLLGFISANDPKFVSTMELIEKNLKNSDGLFLRYLGDDGIKSKDNAFLLLSFWYIEDLIAMGRIKDAKNNLDNILKKSNHLLLFSEEINYTD